MSPRRVPASSDPDFRALFESAPGLYLVLVPDFTIVAVTEAFLQATRTTREGILGQKIFDVFPHDPEDPQATGVGELRSSLDRVLALLRPDAMAAQKHDIRRPESEDAGFEERYWSRMNSPVLGAHGEVAYIIHRVEDVTELVRMKQAGSEEHKAAEEMRTRADRMEAEVFQRAQEIQETNRQLRTLQAELEQRVETRTAALSRTYAKLQREIAERSKTEDAVPRSKGQLRQSQKLEAIGRLVGGIAHDFNNLLTVIMSYTELLLLGLDYRDAKFHGLEEIRHAGQRAAALTRLLLAFSRQQVLEPTVLDVNEVLRNVNRLLERLLGEDILLGLNLRPDAGRVLADRGQIEQVLLNLAVNARDAMPRGGRLTVETANVDLGGALTGMHLDVTPGPYVMIAVSDTGIGMDKDTMARVFEPFFTTKERSKGTGLGLSTVFGIVKQSGGTIWLYSEPGAGTTFKIYLPRIETPTGAEPSSDTAAEALHGTETILLVEDDDQVRAVASSILEDAGYTVIPAGPPEQALRAVERHDGPIDLLLTDVVMPKMNGRELADRVGALRPGIKVLFMSGYTNDAILHHGVLDPGVDFIQKPLTPDALARKVRQVLG